MMTRSRYRLLATAQLVATISVLAACSGGDALEHHAPQAVYSSAGVPTQVAVLADAFADMAPSTMVEMQHFDAYQYYRDMFDLHAGAGTRGDTQPVADSVRGNDAEHRFPSCFRRFK
jgi:hypothetical protein